MQTLEPTGVFARSLAECLALQLRERDRFDPAMQALIENLPALARRDFPLLRRVCGVDDEDLVDMIAEIRRLEPKPGRAFGDPPGAPAIPDVYVTAAPDRTWRVELNSQALPRVLVNETYAAIDPARREAGRGQAICLGPAAVGELADQEPRTTRAHHPQCGDRDRAAAGRLSGRGRVGAEAAQSRRWSARRSGCTKSTVSRATAHKFIQTPRGLFEMKYFFTAAIASANSGEAHSAEAVRQRIRQMIDEEDPEDILSDDGIVERLRQADIVVARRTVAKYRDSLKIPSSVERRKLKMSPIRASRVRGDSLAVEV